MDVVTIPLPKLAAVGRGWLRRCSRSELRRVYMEATVELGCHRAQREGSCSPALMHSLKKPCSV